MNRFDLRLQLSFLFAALALAAAGLLSFGQNAGPSSNVAAPVTPWSAAWSAVGPDGGDARAFAAVAGHPEHIYLGSTGSWIYESVDGGAHWQRLSKLDAEDGLVVDHIVVDPVKPEIVYAAAWKLNEPGGGLWVSHDAGRSWKAVEALRGQSIRTFAMAPTDRERLFAGSLDGVFRSTDAGATWQQISPPGSQEIHEVESLAIDPIDPDVVYAGTWHLPWKTTDGGAHWTNIKKGVIDDSDVFSIIIDPAKPRIVYASACSGIYKSESGGDLFRKIQGIPATARRTRVLMQDPQHLDVVYAGTTEGLYKTTDGGKSFKALTGSDVIVNDVFVDPGNTDHLLLATDRGGVLVSQDGGKSFVASNEGFSGRKVEALLVDGGKPERWYAGVVNDKSYGGVFVTENSGASWAQVGDGGLDGRDVFSLAQATDEKGGAGEILAGTSHGIFALVEEKQEIKGKQEAKGKTQIKGKAAAKGKAHSRQSAAVSETTAVKLVWEPRNRVQNSIVKTAIQTVQGKRVNVEKQAKTPAVELDDRVNALDLTGKVWLAAASGGLYTSRDQGASWQGGPVMGVDGYLSVAVRGETMAAARGDGVVFSDDAGQTWMPMRIPRMLTRIHRVVFSSDGTLWLGAREGVYFTRDLGKDWLWIERMPFRDVDDLVFDAQMGKVLASSQSNDQIYAIDPKTLGWKLWQTGYRIGLVRAAGERLVAASLYDGVLVEPQEAEAVAVQK